MLLRQTAFLVLACGTLAACITHNPGWTGEGAEPFDTSLENCRGEASSVADKNEQETALNACMALRGWRRA